MLKATFPPSKPWIKTLLTEGMIVARVSVTIQDCVDEDLCSFWGVQPIYWHIASMSYSPYEPYIHAMTGVLLEEVALANPVRHRIPGQGSELIPKHIDTPTYALVTRARAIARVVEHALNTIVRS